MDRQKNLHLEKINRIFCLIRPSFVLDQPPLSLFLIGIMVTYGLWIMGLFDDFSVLVKNCSILIDLLWLLLFMIYPGAEFSDIIFFLGIWIDGFPPEIIGPILPPFSCQICRLLEIWGGLVNLFLKKSEKKFQKIKNLQKFEKIEKHQQNTKFSQNPQSLKHPSPLNFSTKILKLPYLVLTPPEWLFFFTFPNEGFACETCFTTFAFFFFF